MGLFFSCLGTWRGSAWGPAWSTATLPRQPVGTTPAQLAVLRERALAACSTTPFRLVMAVDYTKTNARARLHTINQYIDTDSEEGDTPYAEVIRAARVLHDLAPSTCIDVVGFGDEPTQDRAVFRFLPDRDCVDTREVVSRYYEITPQIRMSGPTSFVPAVRHAAVPSAASEVPLLLILTDGNPTRPDEDARALENAADSLRTVIVGIGDGPFDAIEELCGVVAPNRCVFINFGALRGKYSSAWRPEMEAALLQAACKLFG